MPHGIKSHRLSKPELRYVKSKQKAERRRKNKAARLARRRGRVVASVRGTR
jgi:hypothetical protein